MCQKVVRPLHTPFIKARYPVFQKGSVCMKLKKQMAAAVLAAAALSLSLPLSQAQDTFSRSHAGSDRRAADGGLQVSLVCSGRQLSLLGILDREGVDVEGIYTSYRDMVAESDSDQTFIKRFTAPCSCWGTTGICPLWSPPTTSVSSHPPGSTGGAGRRPGPTFSSGKRPAKVPLPPGPGPRH